MSAGLHATRYQSALEEALPQRGQPALEVAACRCSSRASIHFYGTDAKLRVFTATSAGSPAKWMELHRAYLRACELGIDRVPAALPARGPQRARNGPSSRNTCTCC